MGGANDPPARLIGAELEPGYAIRPAPGYATLGGSWLCKMRLPSGLMAVFVPSAFRMSFQPHVWMAMR
jgi:hypothetical protein